MIWGDFSIAKYASGKKISSRTSTYMTEYSDYIEDMELIDPQLDGGSYT